MFSVQVFCLFLPEVAEEVSLEWPQLMKGGPNILETTGMSYVACCTDHVRFYDAQGLLARLKNTLIWGVDYLSFKSFCDIYNPLW